MLSVDRLTPFRRADRGSKAAPDAAFIRRFESNESRGGSPEATKATVGCRPLSRGWPSAVAKPGWRDYRRRPSGRVADEVSAHFRARRALRTPCSRPAQRQSRAQRRALAPPASGPTAPKLAYASPRCYTHSGQPWFRRAARSKGGSRTTADRFPGAPRRPPLWRLRRRAPAPTPDERLATNAIVSPPPEDDSFGDVTAVRGRRCGRSRPHGRGRGAAARPGTSGTVAEESRGLAPFHTPPSRRRPGNCR